MSKPCIAFVTGGYSGEAVISYKSAVTIENNLDLSRYIVYRIDITPEQWFHPTASGEKIDINRNDFSLTIDGRKVIFDAVLIGNIKGNTQACSAFAMETYSFSHLFKRPRFAKACDAT